MGVPVLETVDISSIERISTLELEVLGERGGVIGASVMTTCESWLVGVW